MTIFSSVAKYDMLRQQAIVKAEAALGHPLEVKVERLPVKRPAPGRTNRDSRPLVIELLTQRDGNRCYLCQNELAGDDTWVEHIIPLSKGGTHEAANVALACSGCNYRKANLYVSIGADRRPRYHRR